MTYYVIRGEHGGKPPAAVEGPISEGQAVILANRWLAEFCERGLEIQPYAGTLLWNAVTADGDVAYYVAIDPVAA